MNKALENIDFPDYEKILLDRFVELVQPKRKLKLSDWAAMNRYVSAESSARPGPWNNNLVPFAKEIMDAITEEGIDEISVVGSAQVVKTEIVNNAVGYYIAEEPAPILIVHPTVDMGRAYSKEKLSMVLRDTPVLRGLVSDATSRDPNNSMLEKKFPGGNLTIVGGNSPNALAMRSKRIIITDDADRVPISAGGISNKEGDPVLLAEMRAETYEGISKKIRLSTPTVKGQSRIYYFYDLSDRRRYYVPCPHCGHEQILVFDNLIWDKEKDMFGKTIRHFPETARYICEECSEPIYEKHKYEMNLNGRWIAEKPEIKHHRGYWINRLYSPFASWARVIKDFLNAKDDEEKLRTFYNTSLALAWEERKTESIEKSELMSRIEFYMTDEKPFMPNDILLLVATIDIQKDRLEVLVTGWGKGKESWRIAWQKIWGDTESLEPYETAEKFLQLTWEREDGVELEITAAAIDTGYRTKPAYDFVLRMKRLWNNTNKNMYAFKGVGGYGKPMLGNPVLAHNKRVKRYPIGTNESKGAVFARLNVKEEGERYYHFSKKVCTAEYFEQLTSEHYVPKRSGMLTYQVIEPKRKGKRNEIIDLEGYSVALIELISPNFELIAESIQQILGKKEDKEEKEQEESEYVEVDNYFIPALNRNYNYPNKNFVTDF